MSLKNDRYTYRITWSEDDNEYVGLCAEFPSLSWLAKTPETAFRCSSKTCYSGSGVWCQFKSACQLQTEPMIHFGSYLELLEIMIFHLNNRNYRPQLYRETIS